MSESVAEICRELQGLERKYVVSQRMRIMQENALVSVIARTLGYSSPKEKTKEAERAKEQKNRKEFFEKARKIIAAVVKGDIKHDYERIITSSYAGISAFLHEEELLKQQQAYFAALLPIAGWATAPEQKGFGLHRLAVVIGETGDLADYPNPASVWKRMGCAPFSSDGVTRMGSVWKKKGGLCEEEWTEYGYCPRRRAIAYVLGDLLMKLNKPGPYRRRFEEAKARAAAMHEDWTPMHCLRHANLLTAKLLLRNLWCRWNGKPELNTKPDYEGGRVTDRSVVVSA